MENMSSNFFSSAAGHGDQDGQPAHTTHLPLFPLNTVLFPGMLLPLNIFEPRYLEMINECLEQNSPFGVVLIRQGNEAGGDAIAYEVGTAARIKKAQRLPDGRMSIVVVGTRRFRVETFDHSRAYLSAEVSLLPVTDSDSHVADALMHDIRPDILEYVDLIATASKVNVRMERLPEDPKSTAFLIAGALQVDNAEKQAILEMPGAPAMLQRERRLLSRELLIMRHMVNTQQTIMAMGMGPTGYLFPN